MNTVTVLWDTTRLNGAIKAATLSSFKVAQEDARARRHNKSRSDIELHITSENQAELVPKGLQSVFEQGRAGGYEIAPKKFALKFTAGDGGFAASAVGGPMPPFPAMGPAGQDWSRAGFQSTARRFLAGAGFR
jgi:hypothetical protein